eukprot:6468613-Amphidinium_carterae.1
MSPSDASRPWVECGCEHQTVPQEQAVHQSRPPERASARRRVSIGPHASVERLHANVIVAKYKPLRSRRDFAKDPIDQAPKVCEGLVRKGVRGAMNIQH